MKRKIELVIPLEYWAGESDWRLDHVGPDTVAITNIRGKQWILMICGSRRHRLSYGWVIPVSYTHLTLPTILLV